ncbi:PepSY-associated TM helix domain-containing protein [Viridibacterium curvum]|uniref:PepSY-associated TM helix domain-containing protein n=1 Tax=Viridibacterium curvum TaxID=1101404 RepID=A0ABP9QT15_9RHOO
MSRPVTVPPSDNASHAAATRPRAGWRSQLGTWHWVSSALALAGMLFFALTGITLNHAELFERSTAEVTHREAVLPAPVLAAVNAQDDTAGHALPGVLQDWLAQNWQLAVYPKGVERSEDEVFIDLKRPGVDVSLSIDRHNGQIRYEEVDRGWVAWLNELHRGRNASGVWHAFITVFGVACLVFCITGLLILQQHARTRWTIWPVTGLGLLLPVLLMLLFGH